MKTNADALPALPEGQDSTEPHTEVDFFEIWDSFMIGGCSGLAL